MSCTCCIWQEFRLQYIMYYAPGASYPVLQYLMHQMQPILSYSILCTWCSLSCPIQYLMLAPGAAYYPVLQYIMHLVRLVLSYSKLCSSCTLLSCPTVILCTRCSLLSCPAVYYTRCILSCPTLYYAPDAAYHVLQYIMHQMQPILSYSILCTRCPNLQYMLLLLLHFL